VLVEGSHVINVSQPAAGAEVILNAAAAVERPAAAAARELMAST
jgi:hypothetical protein